ncbi:MAG: EscU/YscU/HrcU family type III secretion system export apparatus switch protein [Gammaproteobacteria bacterium]|nr:EscU/YscU/HrcU family type III secretion system export apparatus switch protein [Gammaproteobacteria bacterium]MCB1923126.1 EscU/YscU/HrcU family type III secretion system export apparatus switch protein [Gammaproteobacteria bacterium]
MKHKEKAVSGNSDIAVALRYDGQGAPRVTAKGEDGLAERIIDAAQQAGVPLYPDAELAMVLSQIPLGEEIPDNLYKAIAEVIAFAYILAGKFPEGFVPDAPQSSRDDNGD